MGDLLNTVRGLAGVLKALDPIFHWTFQTREHRGKVFDILNEVWVDVRYQIQNDDTGGKFITIVTLYLDVPYPDFDQQLITLLPQSTMRIEWDGAKHRCDGVWIYKDGKLTLQWELEFAGDTELLGVPSLVMFECPLQLTTS